MPRRTHVPAPLPLMDALSAAMHTFAPQTLPGVSGRDPPKRKRGRPRRARNLEAIADVQPIARPSATSKSFADDPAPNPTPTIDKRKDAPAGVVPPAKKKARRNISNTSTPAPLTQTPVTFVTPPDSSVERYTPVDDRDNAEFTVTGNGLASPTHAETISPDVYPSTGLGASPTILYNSLSTCDGTTIEVEQHHEVFQAHVIDEVAEPDWGVHITIQPEDMYVGVGADEG